MDEQTLGTDQKLVSHVVSWYAQARGRRRSGALAYLRRATIVRHCECHALHETLYALDYFAYIPRVCCIAFFAHHKYMYVYKFSQEHEQMRIEASVV